MAPTRPRRIGRVSLEVRIVLGLTTLGAVLRLWGLARTGLAHFDEGIYAFSGLWSISGRGLAGLDPAVISYAPGGYPFVVGIAYLLCGMSGQAAILVSVAAGTLTVPGTAWLARRTFGPGAGAAAAAFAALSGSHIAFSRMALTDASFLLAWVLSLVAAQRFLEQPTAGRGVVLGLGVGLAQWFKYSGWLLGLIVILATLIGPAVEPRERSRSRFLATWGYGLLAALVAALVYAPWFAFVEAHGGYARLMEHHRGYLGGLESWRPHLRRQLQQGAMLSGGPSWDVVGWLTALVCLLLVRRARARNSVFEPAIVASVLVAAFVVVFWRAWWIGAFWLCGAPWIVAPGRWSGGKRLLATSWVVLSAMTPLYHPYARLWLPLQQLGWVLLAGMLADGIVGDEPAPRSSRARLPALITVALAAAVLLAYDAGDFAASRAVDRGAGPGVLAPSDSLRRAVGEVVGDLPRDLPGLRLLVRPPVTFYLGGRVAARVEPSLGRLLEPGDSRLWALVDSVQLRQEGDLATARERLLKRWELVREYPTTLNLPTLLDVDPGGAISARPDAANAPLWLLRPRTPGVPR